VDELAIGTTERNAWWIMLEADQTKASRVDERPLLAFMQYLL
jgi:hypothetical protein